MSAVIILVPFLPAVPWAAIGVAVVGVAASMGFSVVRESATVARGLRRLLKRKEVQASASPVPRAEAKVKNTQLAAEDLDNVNEFVLQQAGVKIALRREKDGTVVVCAEGPGRSKAELEALANKVAQRLVQQLVYNRVVTELKSRNFQITNEAREEGDLIRIRVSRWTQG